MAQIAVIGLVGRSMFFDVPRFHSGGETLHASAFHEEWGGKGFNQAVAAARQGAHVSFLGKVGNEADSRAVERFCEEEGIAPFVRHPGRPCLPTACASILTDGTGETRVTVARGEELGKADVDSSFKDAIAAADILLLNNEVPEEVNDEAARIAARNGVRIVMNPAPARAPTATLRETVSVYTPNAFELEALGDLSAYPAKPEVVVTLGGEGCRILSTGETIPAVFFGEPVDTTGAGDTFSGVFATALAEGRSLAQAAAEGNRAAGMSVCRKYPMLSIPRRPAG